MANSFGSRSTLSVGGQRTPSTASPPSSRLPAGARLPFSLKILLENLLRTRERPVRPQGRTSRPWPCGTRRPSRTPRSPSPRPACCCRTSPACRPSSISPPCATPWPTSAATRPRSTRSSRRTGHRPLGAGGRLRQRRRRSPTTRKLEYERNHERYPFLRWGQKAFRNFKVVPPETGIVHQVNLEYLARVVFVDGTEQRLPGHAGRHRLAHHDDQRPGRARLGRRRDRGRGRHARPAGDDAHPAGRRLQAVRQARRRGRPRPTSC